MEVDERLLTGRHHCDEMGVKLSGKEKQRNLVVEPNCDDPAAEDEGQKGKHLRWFNGGDKKKSYSCIQR